MLKLPKTHMPSRCWDFLRLCRSTLHENFQVLPDVKHLIPWYYSCCVDNNLEIFKNDSILPFFLGERKHVLVQTDIGYYLLVWGRIQSGLELPTLALLPTLLFDKHDPILKRNCILKVRKELWRGRKQNILILCMYVFCLKQKNVCLVLVHRYHMFFYYPQIWEKIS